MSQQETAVQEKDKAASTDSPAPETLVKHPLQNCWDLWYYKGVNNNFEDNLFNITSVDNVEDFWGLIDHIEIPSRISPGSAYYFFKKSIRPMWEDSTNKNGGRFIINSNKKPKTLVDNFWIELLLCVIGETFGEYNDHICGVYVIIKNKYERIGIWTKYSNDRDAIVYIGEKIKERINYDSPITFEPHCNPGNSFSI